MRRYPLTALALFCCGMVVSVWALGLVGVQTLKAPPYQKAPSVKLLCADGSLVNSTDPNPLLQGVNGTALFGCGFSTGVSVGISPAVQISRAGVVNASFSLPAGVNIFLIPNPGFIPAMSQSQCTAQGILLTGNHNATLPVGSYSYCESFPDPAALVSVTVSWYA